MSMIPDEQPQESIGRDHNRPPGLLPLALAVDDFKEFLRERAVGDQGKTFQERKAEIIKSARNVVIRTRADVGAAGDIIKIAGKVYKRMETERMDRSQPYRDTADALVRAGESWWEEIDQELDEVRAKMKAWTDAEDQRIEDQRQEQLREMERMRQAAAPPAPELPLLGDAPAQLTPEPTPIPTPAPAPVKKRKIRGDLGAIVSTVDKDTYTVTDVRALPDYVLNAKAVHDAIIAVVRSTKKTLGVPKGIAVSTTQDNQVR